MAIDDSGRSLAAPAGYAQLPSELRVERRTARRGLRASRWATTPQRRMTVADIDGVVADPPAQQRGAAAAALPVEAAQLSLRAGD